MSIAYSVNSKINPIQLDAPGRYYATAKSSGDVTLKQLGKEIAQRSTVNHADTLAVLEVLTQLLGDHIANGDIVRLGDFGRFNISLKSIGAENQAAFTSKNIEKAKINFRPGKDLQDTLKTLTYKKVSQAE